MRFFRIPAFTGIETHRDDADRGSLRVVEGCVPHGPGGLRSGPVWEKIGDVDLFSDSDNSQSHMTGADDGKGNSIVYVSRAGNVHDMAVFNTEHTDLVSLGSTYAVAAPTLYNQEAAITPIGNRLYAMGDGTAEAAYIGKGPPAATAAIFPDEVLYDQEWSRFPSCKFYAQGPKKTIFAAGNPAKPLTVYISEPAGLTNPYRDSPHSTELTNHNAGMLSTVDILSSNASVITALSTRGDQVVVHTDKGCHLLYAPQSDQASTGYRVEQAPATNFSGAVNVQVVAGESGTQPFWLGHDGQIYKDEAASRGAEDFKSFSDPKQASWKAKGQWEKELPVDLTGSFATYDPQSGMYWIYVESDEYKQFTNNDAPSAPFFLKALPEAVESPESLSALAPVLAPESLSALAHVLTPESLIATAESVLSPGSLIASAAQVLEPVSLTANAESVLAPETLIASASVVLIPISLTALAEAILTPDNLNASVSINVPISLMATSAAVLAPENLSAATPVNAPVALTALAEAVLTPESLIGIADAATPISLTAEPLPVLTPENLLANPVHAEKPINLEALGAVIEPQNLVARGGFIENPENLTATAPVLAAYRDDLNSDPDPIYIVGQIYSAGVSSIKWQYFRDNSGGVGASADPPQTSTELSANPWGGTFSGRVSDPLAVFWPSADIADDDFIGPVKFRKVSTGDQYLYWMKMNWGGLRDWGDWGVHGFANTSQWAQTITGTSPSWYIQFKGGNNANDTFTWWLVADTDGDYRFHLLTGADVGTAYRQDAMGNPMGGHANGTMFESASFDASAVFERHSLNYINNTPLRVWATPTPVVPNLLTTDDIISFTDSNGTIQTDSYRTLDTS